MTEYRKRKGRDTWHWCRNCSNWPTSNYDVERLPGKQRLKRGELDNQCLAKEKHGICSSL